MARTHILLILTFLLSLASNVFEPDQLGCEVEPVDARTAYELCGVQEQGLKVVSIEPKSLADEFGLRPRDVIFVIDDQPMKARRDFDRLLFDRSRRIELVFGRAGTKFTTSRAPSLAPGAVRVQFVGEEDSETMDLLERNGVRVQQSLAIPATLDPDQVLVLERRIGLTAAHAKAIESFLKQGGGVVLLGQAPNSFEGASQADAAWIGCTGADVDGYSKANGVITLKRQRPFGSKLERGVIGRWSARVPFLAFFPDKLVETASIVAECENDRYNPPSQTLFAFTNTYGKGRVYYQMTPQLTNYPKIGELFVAGVKWAGETETNDSRG